jgi:hypothetical protein
MNEITKNQFYNIDKKNVEPVWVTLFRKHEVWNRSACDKRSSLLHLKKSKIIFIHSVKKRRAMEQKRLGQMV